MYTRPSSALAGQGSLTVMPEFPVMVLDAALNVVHSGEGKMSDFKTNFAYFDQALLTESGDVYFPATLGKKNIFDTGFFLVSYDHRTGRTQKVEVPDISNKKEWSYAEMRTMFTGSPSGDVFALVPFKAGINGLGISGLGIASFDKEACTFIAWKEEHLHTRDIPEFDKPKDPPYLPLMVFRGLWWSSSGT